MFRICLLLLAHETLLTTGKVQKQLPEILPFNHLVTARLKDGEGKLFYLLDPEPKVHHLSVTIIPCSAPVQWSVIYQNDSGIVNDTKILQMAEAGGPHSHRGSGMFTFKISLATPGLYLVPVWAPTVATTIQIFVSLDPGGPHDLTHLQNPGLKLTPLRRRQLSVRWQHSIVNPQHMNYCVVVSTTRIFSKFCEVQETLKWNKNITDHKMICVHKKNSALIQHLEKGATYYVSLFATNEASRLTVPYGNGSVIISPRVKPIVLVDGAAKSVSLRKHLGRVNFRFRVKETGKDIHMYVVTCGGSVLVQIMQRRHVLQSRRVSGYARFTVQQPRKGDMYSIKITAADADQLSKIRSVEALATQTRARLPLPDMPSVTEVHEYVSSRRCTSVTIGWVPAPGTRALYCVVVRRSPSHTRLSTLPALANQCGLDARPKRASYVAKKCETFTAGINESVTTHNVTNLTPGTAYSVQITVKKEKGRTLSYNLLNVFTKHTCD